MIVLLALLGCRNKDYAADSGRIGESGPVAHSGAPDSDGDGWADDEDCAPEDPSVYPDAVELCNDVDDDCDGAVDEDAADAQDWYDDDDGDGYGEGEAVRSCDALSGHSLQDGDCDDLDAAWYPGAPEDCAVDEDRNCDASTGYADDDGDGWAACEECDDGDAHVNPDALEVCDELDNDCDGAVDDADDSLDTTTADAWYADTDADTYGDPAVEMLACEQPTGFVENDDDCDDTSAEVTLGSTWYPDADSDGYGDAAGAVSCEPPSGWVANSSDCDDTDGDVYPGADEYCDDEDDDCDGSIDEGAVDPTTWYEDGDGDGYGDASGATMSACDEPSGTSDTSDDCDDDDADVNPGEAEACDAVDQDCDGDIDEGSVCPCDVVASSTSTYMVCTSTTTWTSASSTCATYGYSLATIDDATEDSWVDTTVDGYSTGRWWIGFNDRSTENTWVWDSGSSATYTNWHSGEPNDWSTGEDCTELNRWTDGTWNDASCSTSSAYICEAP